MNYCLFIDDERFPPGDDKPWVIARTLKEVQVVIQERGWPSFISFDHDLGDNQPTGYDIVKWMIDQDLDNDFQCLSDDFQFYVHSQNPIGKANIEGLLGGYLKQR